MSYAYPQSSSPDEAPQLANPPYPGLGKPLPALREDGGAGSPVENGGHPTAAKIPKFRLSRMNQPAGSC